MSHVHIFVWYMFLVYQTGQKHRLITACVVHLLIVFFLKILHLICVYDDGYICFVLLFFLTFVHSYFVLLLYEGRSICNENSLVYPKVLYVHPS